MGLILTIIITMKGLRDHLLGMGDLGLMVTDTATTTTTIGVIKVNTVIINYHLFYTRKCP